MLRVDTDMPIDAVAAEELLFAPAVDAHAPDQRVAASIITELRVTASRQPSPAAATCARRLLFARCYHGERD